MSDDLMNAEIVEPQPLCNVCGKPATCIGSYEMSQVNFACDECCGHGCEDGWCQQINADGWLVIVTLERDRIHRILAHIAEHGIHTKNVEASITMKYKDMKRPLLDVLEEEISSVSKPQNTQ